MKYRRRAASNPTNPVISPAGHIRPRSGRNAIETVSGRSASTSSNITMPLSSMGARIVWRTVNAGCVYTSVVASGRTSIRRMIASPSEGTG